MTCSVPHPELSRLYFTIAHMYMISARVEERRRRSLKVLHLRFLTVHSKTHRVTRDCDDNGVPLVIVELPVKCYRFFTWWDLVIAVEEGYLVP